MVDQDLDALLVGALYGELGPADEARLAAHLESHPTDRSALDDLRSTRQALLDSRFFELHFDPPPSVSALLVQEAARRAPRPVAPAAESWWFRCARWFAARPAVAAAAMLVVVVGVAGTLYVRHGADLAEPRVDEMAVPQPTAAASPAPQATPTREAARAEDGNLAGQGIVADVDDRSVDQADHAKQEQRDEKNDAATGSKVALEKPHPANHAPADRSRFASPTGIVVAAHEAQPKDFGTEAPGDGIDGVTARPPPPPPPATSQTLAGDYKAPASDSRGDAIAAAAPTTPASPAGGAAAAPQHADPELAWARDQHARVGVLVKNGRCQDAASVAVQIKGRAPDYYGAYVANDRALKQCQPYITGAVEKAERAKAAADAKAAKPASATDSK